MMGTLIDKSVLDNQKMKAFLEEAGWKFRSDICSEDDVWNNIRQKITQNNTSKIGQHPITDTEFEMIKKKILIEIHSSVDAAKWIKGENSSSTITIEREDTELGSLTLEVYSNQSIGRRNYRYEVIHQVVNACDQFIFLINGLPIIQMGLNQSFQQMKKEMYQNSIFSAIQLFILCNKQSITYFTNNEQLDEKYVFHWCTKDNQKVEDIAEFIEQVLVTYKVHRFVTNYIVIDTELENQPVIVLRPHQIHGIESLLKATKKRQSGFIWHTSGTGKTLSSFMLTTLLARQPEVDRVIMVVDEKDNKEFTTFISEPQYSIVGQENAKELGNILLKAPDAKEIMITTQQKLDAALYFAKKQDAKNGTQHTNQLHEQYTVFVVDDCHNAICVDEMIELKKYFPNSIWLGYTGTPIFEVNKSQTRGVVARTSEEQYGSLFHSYTFKQAVDDGMLVDFKMEYINTVHPDVVSSSIASQLKDDMIYKNLSDDEMNNLIHQMSDFEKEIYIDESLFEQEEHIEKVVEQIMNETTKFDVRDGYPQKSAILTTSSVKMAKKYYYAIKERMKNSRILEDIDFPRIAVTFSVKENRMDTAKDREEMQNILDDYNNYYGTEWTLKNIGQYNLDVHNRLANRKNFGKHIDLVIVVDQLLIGLDAPSVQTIFIDRILSNIKLIQALSCTNRQCIGKREGNIISFRKPIITEQNIQDAMKLYM